MHSSDIFERCSVINKMLTNGKKAEARSSVILLLNDLKTAGVEKTPLVNHFIREVGLYPYLNDNAGWQERFVKEAFKFDVGENEPLTLHVEQSNLLKLLLRGEDVAVSAPTSFGKSFIIDAFIAIRKPKNVVIIVPTVALADETRRRLCHKFAEEYKIITTTDSTLAKANIFVFPQERAFAYINQLESIDILIVDEFYKASAYFDDARSSTLLSTMVLLGKKARQRYYLAPNISKLSQNAFTEGMLFLHLDFKTVYTESIRVWEKRSVEDDLKEFKRKELISILQKDSGKTLIYAGTYSNINDVAETVKANIQPLGREILENFDDWIKINYGPEYSLRDMIQRGFGIHNGQLHRSLSQLQVKLFEEQVGIDRIISTSSIIEGVNTQAENVILWSTKNGNSQIDYFTYSNISGRAGRMFRYFVGKVYLLEEPPTERQTELELEFPETVVKTLDENNPGVQLSDYQKQVIISYQEDMKNLLGPDKWHKLKNNPYIKACDPDTLKLLTEKIAEEPTWPKGYDDLISNNTWDWRTGLESIIEFLSYRRKAQLRTYACIASNMWNTSVQSIHNQVARYGITYEDMFTFERYLTFNISSILSVINILKEEIYPGSTDISPFIHKVSNAFLPKNVYELEEYGLPRMVSKKIQNSGVINLEDDEMEISDVIETFKKIGPAEIERKCHLHPFDKYILRFFYGGIGN